MFGRELTCRYGTGANGLWPTFSYCKISSVDLSEHYKTVAHSFSGTAEEKSSVTVVRFETPSQIEFLPTQILNDFPQLNGIMIISGTLTNIRENFFGQEFNVIEYLNLASNRIATIEANVFQHLPKLKWISLHSNLLHSLPHQLFKNNPDLIAIWLHRNRMNSITPDFFKNLNKLQIVFFDPNECTSKVFGCYTGSGCSVSQSELDSGLTTCFKNCLDDGECAAKSGKLDNLSSGQIEMNLDLIIASGHNQKLIEKGYGDLIHKNDSTPKPEEIENFKNETLECDAKKFEEISQDLKELKVQHETLGNNLTLLIQDHDSELKSLKQELAELKLMLKDRSDETTNLKMELGELFKKELKEFLKGLNSGAKI